MVRVLQCHHFSGQDVFTTDNEPLTSFSSGGLGFIATDQCYIEVYHLSQPGCPRAYRFPTLAPVTALVYSEADDFIATLEGNPSGASTRISIRVYLNWRADLSKQPMRASIAGHMTSLRHVEAADKSRFEVVEVPLKGTPRCIAVDPTFGAIAVGLNETLLVYGFCTKTVAETNEQYQDIKCLLELEFSFPVRQVALVEDYLAVSSRCEIQVVMLKIPLRPGPDISDCSGASVTRKTRAGSGGGEPAILSLGASSSFPTPPHVIDSSGFENHERYTLSPLQRSLSSTGVGSEPEITDNYIVEDEHYVAWSFDEADNTIAMAASFKSSNKMASVAIASAQAVKTIVLKGLATVKGKKHQLAGNLKNGELLGPVDDPLACPVTVEYEDVCNPACKKRGHVIHGVRTCLYRKYDSCAPWLHTLQLVPTYLHATHVRRKETRKCCALCPAPKHDRLVGMSVFFSTPQTGYLYNIQGPAQLLATYPYMRPASCVSVGDHMVYAVTQAGLEVYTSHCLAYTLHHISPMDDTTNTLPPADLEPCLIGLQPFIGAREVCASAGHVLLLNKDVASSSRTTSPDTTSEASWSMYVLRCPSVVDLYQDMVELASEHRLASPPASLHLQQEAHLLLRTHRFLHGTNDDLIHRLICESAAHLGDHYSRMDIDHGSHLTLPYYVISGYDVSTVVRHVTERRGAESQDVCGPGVLRYLDYMFFTQDAPISCSQEDGDLILGVYATLRTAMLSTAILRSALSHYSPEKTLELLQRWMKETNNDKQMARLDILALAVLLLKTGQPDKAKHALTSLSQDEIYATCLAHPWLLHEEYTQFSTLAQMLCRHHRSTFTKVLVALLDTGILRLDSTISILQGRSSLPLCDNRYAMEYLEQVLTSDSRERFFAETARRLVDIYLNLLRKWTLPTSLPTTVLTIRDVIPNGQGHFAKRFTWLDYLAPFTGPDSLLSPCVRLRGPHVVTAVNTDSPCDSCTCCHCNSELLKLQSLLSSSYAPNETLSLVLSEVTASPSLRGQGSLRVLCTARLCPVDAINTMLAEFPSALPHFAHEMIGSDTDLWRHLLDRLQTKVPQDAVDGGADDQDSNLHLQSFKSILADMAEILPREQVLALLPVDDSSGLFDAAIHRTEEKQRARLLKERIISRACQLGQRVN